MLETKELSSYPKIFNLGSPEIEDLFNSDVEITEKLDGSMIRFGLVNDEVVVGSKGINNILDMPSQDGMFKTAVEYLLKQKRSFRENTVYFGEYLRKPKHNTLEYENTPKNNIALFGVRELNGEKIWKWVKQHSILKFHANSLGIDVVPLLYSGPLKDIEKLEHFLTKDSYLGKEKIEGVVIKNYSDFSKSKYSSECYGKYVSSKFKERHKSDWKKKTASIEDFLAKFQNEARWVKAYQHLRDDGKITNENRDIGALIQSVHSDIIVEDTEFIKEELFKFYKKRILGVSVRGLPDWYKKKLMERQFEEIKETEKVGE